MAIRTRPIQGDAGRRNAVQRLVLYIQVVRNATILLVQTGKGHRGRNAPAGTAPVHLQRVYSRCPATMARLAAAHRRTRKPSLQQAHSFQGNGERGEKRLQCTATVRAAKRKPSSNTGQGLCTDTGAGSAPGGGKRYVDAQRHPSPSALCNTSNAAVMLSLAPTCLLANARRSAPFVGGQRSVEA